MITLPPPKPLAGLDNIAPYIGGDSKIDGVTQVIKLSSNEGAFGPSAKTLGAIKTAHKEFHRYPDGDSLALRQVLSDKYKLELERIICGCGSDELINLLCRIYAGPGDHILHTEHGFAMYPIYTKTVGATPISAPESNLTANVDNILKAITEQTKIIFLANPNNPTGTYLPNDEIERLHSNLPNNILLAIDCAYAEYVTAENYLVNFELARQKQNVVILRTFSKIYGMGGIRLGWGYFPEETADMLNRMRSPFNVSYPAQVAGLAAIYDEEFITMSQTHNNRWLKWTIDQCRAMGLTVPDSQTNFAVITFSDQHSAINKKSRNANDAIFFLKSKGIIVRGLAGYGLPNSLRISIGLENEMQTVVASLQEFMD